MRYSSITLAGLVALLPAIDALKFTSPAAGTDLDPTQSIVISWTKESGDPAVFDLHIDNANPNSVTLSETIASGISTSSGSYVVPPNTLQTFGSGYQIEAISGGKTIAQTNGLTLAAGQNQVSTLSNGQLSFVSMTTAVLPSTAAPATATEPAGSVTSGAAAATGASESVTLLSGTASGIGSASTGGFVTSSTTRTASGTAATTSAANSNTANGQMRLGGEVVLSAAGVLAGMVALLA